MTSRASSTDWTSLTVSVNSDISEKARALAALPDEERGGGGGGGGGLDGTKKLTTHAHARKLFNFSLRWLKGDSFSFCLIDSFFLIDLGLC